MKTLVSFFALSLASATFLSACGTSTEADVTASLTPAVLSTTKSVKVVPSQLNCRIRPDVSAKILRSFSASTELVLVDNNAKTRVSYDSRGKPWVLVQKANSTQSLCYVSASSEFIVPLKTMPRLTSQPVLQTFVTEQGAQVEYLFNGHKDAVVLKDLSVVFNGDFHGGRCTPLKAKGSYTTPAAVAIRPGNSHAEITIGVQSDYTLAGDSAAFVVNIQLAKESDGWSASYAYPQSPSRCAPELFERYTNVTKVSYLPSGILVIEDTVDAVEKSIGEYSFETRKGYQPNFLGCAEPQGFGACKR